MAASKAVRFGKQLKELRIHLCQSSPASQGARDFVEQNYVALKQSNPRFPILVRECSNIQPRLWARFEYGKETSVPLSNLSSAQVLEAVQSVAKA